MTSEPARYELSTLEEVIALYRKLPTERGELMVKEVGDAVRYIAAMSDLVEAAGAKMSVVPVIWIDDTKGVGTINLHTAEDAEPFLSMRVPLNGDRTS